MKPTTLTLPTVHLNGTDGGTLADLYVQARAKVRDAIEALKAAEPHGRDYYTQGDGGAFTRAKAEHLLRLSSLETVESELETLALAVATQCDEQRTPP